MEKKHYKLKEITGSAKNQALTNKEYPKKKKTHGKCRADNEPVMQKLSIECQGVEDDGDMLPASDAGTELANRAGTAVLSFKFKGKLGTPGRRKMGTSRCK